jgi:hypothetical protein
MFRFFFLFFPLLFLISCNLREGSKNTGSIAAEQVSMDSEKIAHLKIASAEDYNQALDMLEKKDLKSIDIAIRLFQHAKTDSLSRDSMMVGFNDFLSSVASSYLENNDSLQGRKGIDISDEATRKIKERLAGYGMNLSTSEGEFYLEPDNDYLIQHFGEKISPAYLEFLTISSTEQKQKFADDGTILIPADSIGKRIVTWENFMEKYPYFVSIGKVQDLYAQYMEAYLSGTDNSKVFDPTSNKLKDDLRQSFEAYIAQNPGKKSTSIIKGYFDLLKSNGFVYSEKVDSYILEKLYN